MKKRINETKAAPEAKRPKVVGTMNLYFVPGVGEVEAADLKDLQCKLEAKQSNKPVEAEKVEEGDGNN